MTVEEHGHGRGEEAAQQRQAGGQLVDDKGRWREGGELAGEIDVK